MIVIMIMKITSQMLIEPRIFSSRSSGKVPNAQNSNRNTKKDLSTNLKFSWPIWNFSIFQNEKSNQKTSGCSKSVSSSWNVFFITFVYLKKEIKMVTLFPIILKMLISCQISVVPSQFAILFLKIIHFLSLFFCFIQLKVCFGFENWQLLDPCVAID